MVVAEPAPVLVICWVIDRRCAMLSTYMPAGSVMVLASVVTALAASIASRSEQSPGAQAPRSVSSVRVTLKLAAHTSGTRRAPSATPPRRAARARQRIVVFGPAILKHLPAWRALTPRQQWARTIRFATARGQARTAAGAAEAGAPPWHRVCPRTPLTTPARGPIVRARR